MSACSILRDLDGAGRALLEDREDPNAQRMAQRADVAGVADVLDLAGQGHGFCQQRDRKRSSDGRIAEPLSGSAPVRRRAAGRRSRRRSRPRRSRPRGRYHCAVWLTIPSSAESASRRSANRARASASARRARRRRAARSALRLARTPRHCAPALDHVALLLEDEHVVAVRRRRARPKRRRSARSWSAGVVAARRAASRARGRAAAPVSSSQIARSSSSLPPK